MGRTETEWHKIANCNEIPDGGGIEREFAGRLVALFKADGRIYAVESACPHQGGPLSEGAVKNRVVTCPWHAWQFELETGRSLDNDGVRVQQFPVQLRGEDIFLALT